jgi:hypothetical protein
MFVDISITDIVERSGKVVNLFSIKNPGLRTEGYSSADLEDFTMDLIMSARSGRFCFSR